MTKSKTCRCIDKLEKLLQSQNQELALSLSMSSNYPDRCVVATQKIDTRIRKKTPVLVASFCPFCGNKYLDQKR